ncbi:hypothetical protein NM75_11295 [Dickeya fangzhongdai]|nr:hypothetical protein NM75_11295 [Dickeya fangzhongdai]
MLLIWYFSLLLLFQSMLHYFFTAVIYSFIKKINRIIGVKLFFISFIARDLFLNSFFLTRLTGSFFPQPTDKHDFFIP